MLPHRPPGATPPPMCGTVDHVNRSVDTDVDSAANASHSEGPAEAVSAATSGYAAAHERAAKEVGEGCLLLHRRLHRHPTLPRNPVGREEARLMAAALRSGRAAALDERHPGVRMTLLDSGAWPAGDRLLEAQEFVDHLRVATTVRTDQDNYRPMSACEARLAESLLAPDMPASRRNFAWSLLGQLHDEVPLLMDLDLDELRVRDPAAADTCAWIRQMLSSASTHGAVKPGTTLRVVATQDPMGQTAVLQGHEHRVRALVLQRPAQADVVPSDIADWVQRVAFNQLEHGDLKTLARVVCSFPNLVKIGLPDLGRELVVESGEQVEQEEGSWSWKLRGRVDGVRAFDRLCVVCKTDFAELRPFAERFGRLHRDEILSFLTELEFARKEDDTAPEGAGDVPAPVPTRIKQMTRLLVQAMKDDDLAIRCVFLSRESQWRESKDLETPYQGMRLIAESLAHHPLSPLSSALARGQDRVTPTGDWDWNGEQGLRNFTATLAKAEADNTGAMINGVGVGALILAIDNLPSELLTRAMAAKCRLAREMLAPVHRQITIADLSHQDAAFVLRAVELSLILGVTLRIDDPPADDGSTPRRVRPKALPGGAVAALRTLKKWVESEGLSGVERLQRERWFHHLIAITHDPAPRVLAGVFSGSGPRQAFLDPPPREPLLKLMHALSRSLPLALDVTGVSARDPEMVSRQLGERFFPVDLRLTIRRVPSRQKDGRKNVHAPLNSHLRTIEGPGVRFMNDLSAAQLTRYVAAVHERCPSLVGLSMPGVAGTTREAADLASRGHPPPVGTWVPRSDGRWIRQGFFQQMEAASTACWLVPDLVLQPERMARLMDPEGAGHAVLALIGAIGEGIRAVNSKEIERRAVPLARTVLSGAQQDEAFAAHADTVIAEADDACLDARLSTLWELSTVREFGEIANPEQAIELALHLACRRRAEAEVIAEYPDFEEQVEEALLLKLAVTQRLNVRLRGSQTRPTPEMAFAGAGVNGSNWDSPPKRVKRWKWADRLIDDEIREGLPLVRMELLPDAPGGPALTRVLLAEPAYRAAASARRLEMQARYEQAMAHAHDDEAVTAADARAAEDVVQDRIEVLRHAERVWRDLLSQLPHRLRSGVDVPFGSSDHLASSSSSSSSSAPSGSSSSS